MKNQNLFENIIMDEKLTESEHLRWLIKLRRIDSLTGIESICLSKEELYIEYSPLFHISVSVLDELRKLGFPSKQLKLAPVHIEYGQNTHG